MSGNDAGIIKSIGMANDENGREVLRAIVDFHAGAAPDLAFKVVWDQVPVRIVEAAITAIVSRQHEENQT